MNSLKDQLLVFGFLFPIYPRQGEVILIFIMFFLKIDMFYQLFLMNFQLEFIAMHMKIYTEKLLQKQH